MVSMLGLLIAVIIAALIFDYINGFHDAANAIATVVSTGVLPVRTAVILAGILNFAGAMTRTAVAKTIASGFAFIQATFRLTFQKNLWNGGLQKTRMQKTAQLSPYKRIRTWLHS